MSEGDKHFHFEADVDIHVPPGRPWLLVHEQFHILDMGDPGDAKAWLFLCIGLLVGVAEAVFSTTQNVDWATAFAHHNYGPFYHLIFEVLIGATAIAGLGISGVLMSKKKSFCSDLKKRIRQHFEEVPAKPPAPEIPDSTVSVASGSIQKS